jgi:large subunit ribosomal protein L10e
MAKLRKAVAYRGIERPYTRKSKYKKKAFVKAIPTNKVISFDMGDKTKKFEYTLNLRAKSMVQIRHNAIESARQTSNRYLEKNLGKSNYNLKVMVYPHHILRENPLASGAGADRFSTGMQKAFGKPLGIAARVKEGQKIMRVSVNKGAMVTARNGLKRAQHKFPCGCSIEVIKNEEKE